MRTQSEQNSVSILKDKYRTERLPLGEKSKTKDFSPETSGWDFRAGRNKEEIPPRCQRERVLITHGGIKILINNTKCQVAWGKFTPSSEGEWWGERRRERKTTELAGNTSEWRRTWENRRQPSWNKAAISRSRWREELLLTTRRDSEGSNRPGLIRLKIKIIHLKQWLTQKI